MDDFIQEVRSTLEDELQKRRPGAVILASTPEPGSEERVLRIMSGYESYVLVLGPGAMDQEDVPAVIRTLREGDWLSLLWQYGCLRVECSDGEYHLVLCESPDSSTS